MLSFKKVLWLLRDTVYNSVKVIDCNAVIAKGPVVKDSFVSYHREISKLWGINIYFYVGGVHLYLYICVCLIHM